MAGNKVAKHDIAPAVRAAFIEALNKIKLEKGKTFSQIMAEWIEADGLGPVLNAVSKFTVREQHVKGNVKHDHNHQHTHEAVSETVAWIEGIVREPAKGETKKLN